MSQEFGKFRALYANLEEENEQLKAEAASVRETQHSADVERSMFEKRLAQTREEREELLAQLRSQVLFYFSSS